MILGLDRRADICLITLAFNEHVRSKESVKPTNPTYQGHTKPSDAFPYQTQTWAQLQSLDLSLENVLASLSPAGPCGACRTHLVLALRELPR